MTEIKAYVEGFEADVFVSYAHFDDRPVKEGGKGWVSQFCADLRNRLPERLVADPKIWLDEMDIRNHEDFDKKISRQLANTATMVAIVSESFLQREWCRRELEEFASHAQHRYGVYVAGEQKRIFPVERLPVSRDVLPTHLQGTKTYRFFEGQNPLQPFLGDESFKKYYGIIQDLSIDISSVLKWLAKQARAGGKPIVEEAKTCVYLAQTTSHLDDQAARIRRELIDRDYRVLPDADLPWRLAQFDEKVRSNLEKCALSIHLIGADYGFIPEGEALKSSVWLQYALALAHFKSVGRRPILWIADDRTPTDTRQRAFLEFLANDNEVQARSTFLANCGIEDLKTVMLDALMGVSETATRRPAIPSSIPTVYVIADPSSRDTPDFLALKDYLLRVRTYDLVFLEPVEGEASLLQQHIDNFESCDACLIYYDRKAPEWLHQKLNDLRKYLKGRDRPVLAKAIYLTGDARDERIETPIVISLPAPGAFAPGQLQPFVNSIDDAQKALASR